MGDPKKHKSKYPKPSHPWQKARIDEESVLLKEFGLKNKKELWKSSSLLKSATNQAKRLIADKSPQAQKEEAALLAKLSKLGVLPINSTIEEVLNLTPKAILERRLQTMVFRKGFARSLKQSRQFITHQHILVNGKKISSPLYLVSVAEEGTISFVSNSTLADEAHPERAAVVKDPAKEAAKAQKREARQKRQLRDRRR